MRFRPSTERFTSKHEARLYEILRTFPSKDSIEFTMEIKGIMDLIISIVIVKKRWMDPEGQDRDCDDLVQHAYLHTPRILQNMWIRLHTKDNPIRSAYSYLFKAYENKMRDFIRSLADNTEPLEFIEDWSDQVQVEERSCEEISTGRFQNIYTQIYLEEVTQRIFEGLRNFPIRLKGEKALAYHWLCFCYLRNYEVTEWDLWPFSHKFNEELREFVFDYFEVTLRKVIKPFKFLGGKYELIPFHG